MDIVTVIGTVVATQKAGKLNGYKLLLVANDQTDKSTPIVAVDTVGAGVGEKVLLVRGSSARAAAGLADVPVDAAIIGIVDQIEQDGETVFDKSVPQPGTSAP
jgi:ethanolamine utilization protein EutN